MRANVARVVLSARAGGAAAREQHVEAEHDDRADDRSDDAGGLQEAAVGVGAEQQEAEEAADERPDDSEDDSASSTDGSDPPSDSEILSSDVSSD